MKCSCNALLCRLNVVHVCEKTFVYNKCLEVSIDLNDVSIAPTAVYNTIHY